MHGETSIAALLRVALYKRMKAVVVFPVLVALCAVGIVMAVPKRYDASATIQIDPRQKLRPATSQQTDSEKIHEFKQESINAELSAVQSARVLRAAIDALHLDDDPEFKSYSLTSWISGLLGTSPGRSTETALSKHLSISRLRNTLLVSIAASSSDPVKSAHIANAIAAAYLKDWSAAKSSAETAATMLGQRLKDDLDGDGTVTQSEHVFASFLAQYGQNSEVPGPSIVAAAVTPREATAAKPARTAGIAFVLALAASIAAATLLEIKTSAHAARVKSAFACSHVTSLPTIPVNDAASVRACRFVLAEPTGAYAEAVRETCRELEKRRSGAPSRLTLVVSALAGEGAECLASNIAHQYAIAGHATLLIDADLRMGALTQQLAGNSASGVLDQMANRKPVTNAILRDCATGLHFLPACGETLVPLPVRDILRSKAFADAVAALRRDFVTIVVSAPPLLAVDDACTLASLADDIVFVIAWQKTPKRLAKQALAKIATFQAKIVSAALTDIAGGKYPEIMSLYEVLDEMRAVAPRPIFKTHAA